MRVLVQRVLEARVDVEGQTIGKIGKGLLLFFGVHKKDTEDKTLFLAKKIVGLRLFSDEVGKMNLDVRQVGGGILVVSQFTLYGNCFSGKRPDFIDAAPPQLAEKYYEKFMSELATELEKPIERGSFGAYMQVHLQNDGPVTFLLEK